MTDPAEKREIPTLTLTDVALHHKSAMDSWSVGASLSTVNSGRLVALCRLAGKALRAAPTERIKRPVSHPGEDDVQMPARADGTLPAHAPADYQALLGAGTLSFEALARVSRDEVEWGPNSIHRKFHALLLFVDDLRRSAADGTGERVAHSLAEFGKRDATLADDLAAERTAHEETRSEVAFLRGEIEKWRNALGLVAAQLDVKDEGSADEIRAVIMAKQLELLEIKRLVSEAGSSVMPATTNPVTTSMRDGALRDVDRPTATDQQLRRIIDDIMAVVPRSVVNTFSIRHVGKRTELQLIGPGESLENASHVIAYVDHAGLWILTLPDERNVGAGALYEVVPILAWIMRWHGDQSKRPKSAAIASGEYRWAERVAWAMGRQ